MKKKIVLLWSLVLVMCSLLCACGSNNSKYVEIDGERYGIEEIPQEVRENELKFGDYYSKEATIVGQVDKVEYGARICHVTIDYWWRIALDTEDYGDMLAELSQGDTVCVRGKMTDSFGAWIDVEGTSIQLQ